MFQSETFYHCMYKKNVFVLLFVLNTFTIAQAQTKNNQPIDSLVYYDELFNELESFIDSITAPRSFALINLGISNGYLNYASKTSTQITSRNQMIFTPSIGYFHKNGLGISASASVINDSGSLNFYQLATTASYDYLKTPSSLFGFSYTHYFTKDSLSFYTSPLNNALFAYFSYKRSWLKPTISASYEWGSRTNYTEREDYIKLLRLRTIGNTIITTTEESISDFSVTASVKHDFYWLDVLSKRDFIRLTPQLLLISGTQKYGFNQTNNTYISSRKTGADILYNSENTQLSSKTKFQPLYLSARIRTEFSKGKFFIQPQLMFDYYFPAQKEKLATTFALNTGIIL